MRILFLAFMILLSFGLQAQSNPDYSQLEGTWEVDLTPDDPNDSVGTQMVITKADKKKLDGTFYGSLFKESQVGFGLETIHFAFVTSDKSGDYNTAVRFVDGKMIGTTHALARDFLSVWTATRKTD